MELQPTDPRNKAILSAVGEAAVIGMAGVCVSEAVAPGNAVADYVTNNTPVLGPLIEHYPVASAAFFSIPAVISGLGYAVRGIRRLTR